MKGSFSIRNYHEKDRESVKRLYKKLIEYHADIIYWWPGPEFTWDNVFCVFYKDFMIAKGQVQIINEVSPDYQTNASHLIFINIKVHPKWKENTEVRNIIYDKLLEKAKLLKEKLSPQFPTKLCAGNYATESKENEYLEVKGFRHFKSLYWMKCEVTEEAPQSNFKLLGVDIRHWPMASEKDEINYLKVESEIWPNNPTSRERLREYKKNPFWKAITAFYNDEIIGSVIAWKEQNENIGTIEDVFVKPNWRNRGLAKHLITEGIQHFKNCNLEQAQLFVETKNQSALKLYKSFGFGVEKEEKRYWIEL